MAEAHVFNEQDRVHKQQVSGPSGQPWRLL